MGVTYKLKDEVVHFIISQRQVNPLFSCRQLAESASEKFGVNLSKSSVHDVLKESGIVTPRGRKPKDKFKIPQEKKKQIQNSLSQVKLLPDPFVPDIELLADAVESNPSEYQGAGKIFLKAALWDLGIFSEDNIKEEDWRYYLTYSKGINVVLESNESFFIDLALPLERCIREAADGLINNVRPFIVDKVSDQKLFQSCMDAQPGFGIKNISIVGCNDHILSELSNIVEYKRYFMRKDRLFVENYKNNPLERAKELFLLQHNDSNGFMNILLNLNGFDTINKDEFVVNLLVGITDDRNKVMFQQAAEKLNGMCLYDEQGRLVKVKIQE